MRRSIATVSLSGTLREKLEAIAAARFDGIELFENDFTHFHGTATDLRLMTKDLGLSIDLFQPFRDFEAMPEPMFAMNLERAERKFDLMQAMGAQLMLCCSNTSPQSINDPDLAAAQLHELASRAAQRNLRVGFEALAWGRHTRLYRQAWDIVKRANHPHLGLILDSFHTLSLKDDPAGIADIPGHKIFFLQMADAPWMSLDVLHWARHHRCFPGQGQFDVVNFLRQVLNAGYTGPLSLEIFNDVFRSTSNRRIAVDAMRSLLYLESELRRDMETPAKAPVEPWPVEIFAPPKAPELGGISFIEFAALGESALALGQWLQSLGFEPAGRHRSKAVTLYRQGGVNLIVNAQPGSLASQRFELAGPRVCAWGVQTASAPASIARATAMCSQRYDGPIGPSELPVPALVAPGGSLIYFVPAALGETGLFEADFELNTELQSSSPLGIQRVDHLAMGLAPEQLATWVLFSRAVLGLTAGDSIDIADPFGLIRSQSVFNDSRTVRHVLNVSGSQTTRTAKDVQRHGGAVVQHMALACEDLLATVEQLRARGVAFVPISDNYFEDLSTRVNLRPDLLGALQELGVMFDRNERGDYLHIYTEPFQERFFFELVQRIDGYDAYGGLNAGARMATQATALGVGW